MQAATLTVTLHNFCIERALSPYSKHNSQTFIDHITGEDGSISPKRIADCLNPRMDFGAINADTSPFDQSYMEESHYPTASEIQVTNIRRVEEEETIYCDASWVFNDFKISSEAEALESLQTTEEELGIYMLQMHSEILRSFGLRNNRRSQPKISVKITPGNT